MKSNTNGMVVLAISTCLTILSTVTTVTLVNSDMLRDYHTTNIANTVDPILRTIAERICYGSKTPLNKGAVMITKPESRSSCISGKGNTAYVRCFDYIGRSDGRFDESLEVNMYLMPMKDIPFYSEQSYSCIEADEVVFPGLFQHVRFAEIGEPVVRF